jgi:hypothetical protein
MPLRDVICPVSAKLGIYPAVAKDTQALWLCEKLKPVAWG